MPKIENMSPLDPVDRILLGGPGTEAVMGLLFPPHVSLFEVKADSEASIVTARQEHNGMSREFEKRGIEVVNMRCVIGQVLAERARHPYTSINKLRNELWRRAEQLFKIHGLSNIDQARYEIEMLLAEDARTMGVDAAIAINGVLNNVFDVNGRPVEFHPELAPAANFMFWRDTNHVTGKEMGTHSMFWPIREQEVLLAELGFDALELEYERVFGNLPNHLVERYNDDGERELHNAHSIEGGDAIGMELDGNRYAFLGSAERTSREALAYWYQLHQPSLSTSGDGLIPMAVFGPTSNTQDQMHLDTFVAQIAPGALIHCGEITSQREIKQIIGFKDGELIYGDPQNFSDWINDHADAYNMSVNDQQNYVPNLLTSGNGLENGHRSTTVYIAREGSPEVMEFIRSNVAEAVVMDIHHMTKMYGSVHCTTSETRKS